MTTDLAPAKPVFYDVVSDSRGTRSMAIVEFYLLHAHDWGGAIINLVWYRVAPLLEQHAVQASFCYGPAPSRRGFPDIVGCPDCKLGAVVRKDYLSKIVCVHRPDGWPQTTTSTGKTEALRRLGKGPHSCSVCMKPHNRLVATWSTSNTFDSRHDNTCSKRCRARLPILFDGHF